MDPCTPHSPDFEFLRVSGGGFPAWEMGNLQLNCGGNALNPTMCIGVTALSEMLLGLDRLDRQDSCSAPGCLSRVQLRELGSKL